jgi:hypothetical protein
LLKNRRKRLAEATLRLQRLKDEAAERPVREIDNRLREIEIYLLASLKLIMAKLGIDEEEWQEAIATQRSSSQSLQE